MCGIAGILGLQTPVPDDGHRIQAMCDALAHRGPDDEGYYHSGPVWLGHRRLSIIDIAGGHQPLCNEDGTLWITYNGEVFNYRELRRELELRGHRFRTQSDTEVVVHLYEEEGPECFRRLNGQFALALWDERRQELVLARDSFGILPLYWTEAAGRFLLASEIKGLLASGWVAARPDLKGLAHVATFGALLAPRTMFEGVQALPAGHWLRLQRSPGAVHPQRDERWHRQIQQYADIDFPAAGSVSRRPLAYWRARLRHELAQAVRRRLVADVPVGLYLSGGIDSSIVGSLMGEQSGVPPMAFHVSFDDASLDEAPSTDLAARHIGSPCRRVQFNDALLAQTIAPLVRSAEAPMFSVEPAPLWRLSELTSRWRKVVLSGQGADEMFGGYPYVTIARLRQQLESPPWSLLRTVLAQAERLRTGVRCVFPPESELRRVQETFGFVPALHIVFSALQQMRELFSPEVRAALADYSPYDEIPFRAQPHWHIFDRWMYVAYKTNLENYLLSVQGDRPAMAHSVEVRFPFLDPELVAFCAQIPPELRHRRGCEKYILRETARGLVPEPIRRRRKQPFMASWGAGFLRNGDARLHDLLSPSTVRAKGYFDPQEVSRYMNELRELSDAGRPLSSFAALTLNRRFQRLCLRGMGINFVVTTHLWDELFARRQWQPPTPHMVRWRQKRRTSPKQKSSS